MTSKPPDSDRRQLWIPGTQPRAKVLPRLPAKLVATEHSGFLEYWCPYCRDKHIAETFGDDHRQPRLHPAGCLDSASPYHRTGVWLWVTELADEHTEGGK